MALTAGSRFGPYEIVALIGVGGMGEVYRARDPRLKRDVAIKVLPDEFAQDPDRLARFQREAEVLASLNHPNIAAVYGIEEVGDTRAIVMEFVEGPTLAQSLDGSRLRATGLPVDEVLTIARQIAAGVEAAHDKGIVHRDLKPANVKVTPEGVVKILDFGLAKLTEVDPASVSPDSPTVSGRATRGGVILGTAAYMSPEQARGQKVDRRTDIWTFGCVVFELLTGRQTFGGGDTVSDAIAAILKNDPDWNALPIETPTHIRTLLRRCLQKDPQKRVPHIGMARLELEESPIAAAGQPIAGSRAPSGVKSGLYGWSAAVLLLVVSAALGALLLLRREPADAGSVRLTVAPPNGWTLWHNVARRGVSPPAPHIAVSPDGQRLAYVMYATGKPQLWVRRLDALDGQPLPGTDDASFPFWSADGRFIAFFAAGKLRKIDAARGLAQTICDAPAGEGGTWNLDGDIVFAPDVTGPLSRVSAAGGAPTPLTTLDPATQEVSHRWPQFLPDDRHFLFLAGGRTADLFVGSLDSPDRSLVMKGADRTLYASGHLLFVREGTLMAQPFEPASFRLSGEPTPVVEDVASNTGNHRTGFSASETGVLAYRTGGALRPGQLRQVTRFDRSGKRLEVVGTPGAYAQLRLAPGDTSLAVLINDSAPLKDWWILDLTRAGVAARFTTDSSAAGEAFWSPDGARLVFGSGTPIVDLYQKSVAGGGDPELLLKTPFSKASGDWSESAQHIIYAETRPETGGDLWILPLTKDAQPRPFLQTSFSERSPRFSPDGRWVAYVSNEGGRDDVYVRAFPSGDRKARVSVTTGDTPIWRRDGRELFYLENAKVMAVDVRTGAAFESGTPRELFETQLAPGSPRLWDATGSGQQFLIAEGLSADTSRAITLVVNWPSLLKR